MRVVLSVLMILALAAAPAAADHHDADSVPWSSYLPPFSTVANPQPGPVPNCRRARLSCVDRVERRLLRMRKRLGCDHRAIFPVTYAHVTRLVGDALRDRSFYRYRNWLIYQDVVFANYYFRAFRDHSTGRPIPPAWQVAFDAWQQGDTSAGQDMLLGINAHVQRDMPFVLAQIGLRTRAGVSRKPDHERGNVVLSRAYDGILDDIGTHYDPLVTTADASPSPLDDIGALQLVRGWREGVWRNAERLLNARDEKEYREVAASIEAHAEAWARAFVAAVPPGTAHSATPTARRISGSGAHASLDRGVPGSLVGDTRRRPRRDPPHDAAAIVIFAVALAADRQRARRPHQGRPARRDARGAARRSSTRSRRSRRSTGTRSACWPG